MVAHLFLRGGLIGHGDELHVARLQEGPQGLRPALDGTVGSVLSRADGKAKCRLRFELKDGTWKGLANWGRYETKWELSVTADGLVGRAEWITVLKGKIVTRGWSGRTFTKLKRVH